MKISMLDGPEMGGILRGTPGRERAAKEPKEPSTSERMVSNAHDAKVHATDRWVRGEMTSKEHSEVHKKADKVISCKGRM